MKNVNKVDIHLVFPQGAHFFGNVNEYIYRKFIGFIYRLNCLQMDSKCVHCSIKDSCRYYRCTGENFTHYPGLVMENNTFYKSIYARGEKFTFTLYFIGNVTTYKSYLEMFFQSYLENKLSGNFYYLEDITSKGMPCNKVPCISLSIISPVQSTTINEVNDMITYYNVKYNCTFELINFVGYRVNNIQKHKQGDISFITRKVNLKGYTYSVVFDNEIYLDSELFVVGIGKYNYLGGGKIET